MKQMTNYSNIVEVTIEHHIATVQINHPPLNVLGKRVVEGLLVAFQQIEKNDTIRVVILTSAGQKAFMAGADIKEFPTWLGDKHMDRHIHRNHQLYNYIDQFPKPTIAVLNGLTLGGGCELALCCDFRIAEQHVKIGLPEINLGIFPGGGGTQRLPRLIGMSKAKELIFFGGSIDAQDALTLGLVNKVTASSEGLTYAKEWAEQLATKSSYTLSKIKEAMMYGADHSIEEGIQREAELFYDVFQHPDAFEGVGAFIKKREPSFNQHKKVEE